MARICLVTGALLIIAGLCLMAAGKIPGLGRLPGDILIKKGNFTLYAPLTTCLLFSLLLTMILFLWNQK